MIILTDKKNCCGCNGCVQACPVHCIAMKIDDEGFWYPEVNESICIHCNQCNRVCPIENSEEINSNSLEDIETYVSYTKNFSVRGSSSSGGIFFELAKKTLQDGGIVFGAAFADDFSVELIQIDCIEQLNLLQGSKYLQAKVGETYKAAEAALKTGKPVLYSATPCYAAGLRAYLGRDYDNLLLVDVLCHGVPSPFVWGKHIQEKTAEYGSAIKTVNFRDKESSWRNYALKIEFVNGEMYRLDHSRDDYMRLFLSNICLRPCCHECHFKGMDRPADITLGDCWGVENKYPEMDDDGGTSVVLLHTTKGKAFFDGVASELVCKKAILDEALPPQSDSRKSVMANANRDKFFYKLKSGQTIHDLTKLTRMPFIKRAINKIKRLFV